MILVQIKKTLINTPKDKAKVKGRGVERKAK